MRTADNLAPVGHARLRRRPTRRSMARETRFGSDLLDARPDVGGEFAEEIGDRRAEFLPDAGKDTCRWREDSVIESQASPALYESVLRNSPTAAERVLSGFCHCLSATTIGAPGNRSGQQQFRSREAGALCAALFLLAVDFYAGVVGTVLAIRRGSQVVRPRSAKPLCAGSIPARASNF